MIQLVSLQLISALFMIIVSITMLFGGIALTENALSNNDVLVVNNNGNDINAINDGKYLNDNSINTGQDNYYLQNNQLKYQLTTNNNSETVHLLAYNQEKINLFNSTTQSTLFSHINEERAPPITA